MKYHDSIAQAHDKLTKAVTFLRQHQLPATPVNYAVAYEHVSGADAQLSQAVNAQLKSSLPLDNYFIQSLYDQFLVKASESHDQLVDGVDSMITSMTSSNNQSGKIVQNYLQTLDSNLVALNQASENNLQTIISSLIEQTWEMKKSQQQLQNSLAETKKYSENLKSKLQAIKESAKQDAMTGLYNFSAMQEQVEIWLSEKPNRDICAIAIDIDNFSQFNDMYGHMVGDVVLNKVARKIKNYVEDSGLPVRTGGEEFLILIPDIDHDVAREIAEQVRKGVEKMRFVSAKSKRKLPPVTISLGISNYDIREDWYQFMGRMGNTVKIAKAKGKNRVVAEAYA